MAHSLPCIDYTGLNTQSLLMPQLISVARLIAIGGRRDATNCKDGFAPFRKVLHADAGSHRILAFSAGVHRSRQCLRRADRGNARAVLLYAPVLSPERDKRPIREADQSGSRNQDTGQRSRRYNNDASRGRPDRRRRGGYGGDRPSSSSRRTRSEIEHIRFTHNLRYFFNASVFKTLNMAIYASSASKYGHIAPNPLPARITAFIAMLP